MGLIRKGEEQNDLTSSKRMYQDNASPRIALLLLQDTTDLFFALFGTALAALQQLYPATGTL